MIEIICEALETKINILHSKEYKYINLLINLILNRFWLKSYLQAINLFGEL